MISEFLKAYLWRTEARLWPTLRGFQTRFCFDQRGAVLIAFSLALPALIAAVSAATEYVSITNRRSQLQNAADGAALAAGKELTLANSDEKVATIAKQTAISSLSANSNKPMPDVASQVLNNRTAVEVTIEESIPFMMGHYLGVPTADVAVKLEHILGPMTSRNVKHV